MRNIVLGFTLFTLVMFIFIVIGHIVGVVGLLTDQVILSDFYFLSPASILLLLLNIKVIHGLKKYKKWAYLIASIEIVMVFINSSANLWVANFSSGGNILIIALSVLALFALYGDFTHARIKE